MSNTYTYDIPKNMPQGAYWYHSHLHGLTAAQVYTGLVGLLSIGRTDGNLPLVTQNRIPVRNMLLQYNFVFDRDGGSRSPQQSATGRNSSARSSRRRATSWRRAPTGRCWRRSISPSPSPARSTSPAGMQGPLSIRNKRGLLQFIPTNLQRFTAAGRQDRERRRRPTPRCRTTSATCSSPSTASSSRSSRARPGRPRSGCSPMSATSPTSTSS